MRHRPGQLSLSLTASIAVHALALWLLAALWPNLPATPPAPIIPTLRLHSPPPTPAIPEEPTPPPPDPEPTPPPPPPVPPPPPPPKPEPPKETPPQRPIVPLPKEPTPEPNPPPEPEPKIEEPRPKVQEAPAPRPAARTPASTASVATIRARPFQAPNPPYPATARRDGAEGEVLVAASIQPDGTVASVAISRSSGRDDLDHAAAATVRSRWRFRPATRAGRPVPSRETVLVRFVLED